MYYYLFLVWMLLYSFYWNESHKFVLFHSHHTVVGLFNSLLNCVLPCSLADTASQTIGQCGGVKAVITTMRLFSHQVDIVTPCCNALWTLAVSGNLYLAVFYGMKISAFVVIFSLIFKYSSKWANEEPCKIRHQWQHLTHQVITTCIVTHIRFEINL